MKFNDNTNAKKPNNKQNDEKLGFRPEWIYEVVVGDEKDKNKSIYKKLDKPIEVEANNYKRKIDVFIASASKEDTNQLLNYISPKA